MRSLFFLLLFISSATLAACTCRFAETLCQYADEYYSFTTSDSTVSVAQAVYIGYEDLGMEGHYLPVYHYRVLSVLVGAGLPDTISLHGQDGLNCNGYDTNPLGSTVALLVNRIDDYQPWGARGRVDSIRLAGLNFYPYPGCGPNPLPITDGMIWGPVAPGRSWMALDEFTKDIPYCFDGLAVGVDDEAAALNDEDINCYPNPVADQLTVQLRDHALLNGLTLFDATGRRLSLPAARSSNTEMQLDVRSLPAGVYTLLIEADGRVGRRRIVVR